MTPTEHMRAGTRTGHRRVRVAPRDPSPRRADTRGV